MSEQNHASVHDFSLNPRIWQNSIRSQIEKLVVSLAAKTWKPSSFRAPILTGLEEELQLACLKALAHIVQLSILAASFLAQVKFLWLVYWPHIFPLSKWKERKMSKGGREKKRERERDRERKKREGGRERENRQVFTLIPLRGNLHFNKLDQ